MVGKSMAFDCADEVLRLLSSLALLGPKMVVTDLPHPFDVSGNDVSRPVVDSAWLGPMSKSHDHAMRSYQQNVIRTHIIVVRVDSDAFELIENRSRVSEVRNEQFIEEFFRRPSSQGALDLYCRTATPVFDGSVEDAKARRADVRCG